MILGPCFILFLFNFVRYALSSGPSFLDTKMKSLREYNQQRTNFAKFVNETTIAMNDEEVVINMKLFNQTFQNLTKNYNPPVSALGDFAMEAYATSNYAIANIIETKINQIKNGTSIREKRFIDFWLCEAVETCNFKLYLSLIKQDRICESFDYYNSTLCLKARKSCPLIYESAKLNGCCFFLED